MRSPKREMATRFFSSIEAIVGGLRLSPIGIVSE